MNRPSLPLNTQLYIRPKKNKALFPTHHPGENFLGRHPAAKKNFFYFSLQYLYLYEMSQHDKVWSHISCFEILYGGMCQFKLINPIFWPRKIKWRIFDDIYLYKFSKKKYFCRRPHEIYIKLLKSVKTAKRSFHIIS